MRWIFIYGPLEAISQGPGKYDLMLHDMVMLLPL